MRFTLGDRRNDRNRFPKIYRSLCGYSPQRGSCFYDDHHVISLPTRSEQESCDAGR